MRKIVCHGCKYFFITYRPERPWGCRKFGFISKMMPYSEVFLTTGMECAYRKERKVKKLKNIEAHNE
tara:strand:- start:205 stop:405 length:201 start_codon:yes stop_codon:yes gene_type:complete